MDPFRLRVLYRYTLLTRNGTGVPEALVRKDYNLATILFARADDSVRFPRLSAKLAPA